MSASISKRRTKDGKTRYLVRYRLGGRSYPVKNAGTFPTERLAKVRRDLVAGEVAAGRDPQIMLSSITDRPPVRTLSEWAAAYTESRIDAADETVRSINSAVKRITPTFGESDPHAITPTMVAEWVAGIGLKQATVRRYLQVLKQILDYAAVRPNPARDSRVRLPREERQLVEPPSAAHVAAILAHVAGRHRLSVETLAATGMRVGELCDLEWRDVDSVGERFRVRGGKTVAARRWVAVPSDVMTAVLASCAPDDRVPERKVFQGATPNALKKAITNACRNASIAHYHPHDLRHRWASVQIAQGVPVTVIAAHLGHSRKSLTLDTYSHVLVAE